MSCNDPTSSFVGPRKHHCCPPAPRNRYATFDYEEGQYRPADLQRMDILAHGKPVDALARMVARSEVAAVGRSIIEKMSKAMDRQQFDIILQVGGGTHLEVGADWGLLEGPQVVLLTARALQASADGRVVARETIRAVRKNVLAKCYGGDVTRKRKLLDKQKEGKRKLKRLGNIEVPQELFPELMKTR